MAIPAQMEVSMIGRIVRFTGLLGLVLVLSAQDRLPTPHATSATCTAREFQIFTSPERWIIRFEGKVVVEIGEKELLDIWGGKSEFVRRSSAHCGDLLNPPGSDYFGFRNLGANSDLLMLFGVNRDSAGKPIALSRLNFYEHDGTMTVRVEGTTDVVVTYGRDKNRNARLCWRPKESNEWFHNANMRDSFPPGPCVNHMWRLHDKQGVFYIKL